MAFSSPAAFHEWTRTRDLLLELIGRDIKLRYRGSVLGILWTLLNPLAELLVLYLVFGTVLRVDIPHFPAYLFTGLIVYGWFQNSVNFATGAVVANRELVRRPGVAVAILPIVTVASNLVHFLLSLPILLVLLLGSQLSLTRTALALPLLVAVEFALILGCAYLVATVNVWFRDTPHVLRIALQLLFYLTPWQKPARDTSDWLPRIVKEPRRTPGSPRCMPVRAATWTWPSTSRPPPSSTCPPIPW